MLTDRQTDRVTLSVNTHNAKPEQTDASGGIVMDFPPDAFVFL